MSALSLTNVGVRVGARTILSDISFTAARGAITAIVGESGSGKTMTLRAIMHLAPHAATLTGAVTLNDKNLMTLDARAMDSMRGAEIGMVFQEPLSALNPVQTILAQIAETIVLHRRAAKAEARELALEAMDRVGLPRDFAARFPHELSGGQRQRAAIAIAVALKPSVLLADEPTTALDVTTQAHILALFQTLAREENMAIVLVTHDLAVVSGIADRIIVMRDGAIMENVESFAALSHPYSRALITASALPPRTPATPKDEMFLEAQNLSTTYKAVSLFKTAEPVQALTDVSFTLRKGERLGVVGESGAGKSTLARLLLGLEAPSRGAVRIGGLAWTGAAERVLRRRIQIVFQDPASSFDPRQRIGEAIAAPLRLLETPLDKGARTKRVATMLEEVGLSAADAQRYPHELSGGQRQRVAFARALIIKPDILVLDEAVTALDATLRAQILDLLTQTADREGLSFIFISHDLSVVRAIADRVLVMQHGRIVEDAPADRLFSAPQHAYTQALIAATPRLSAA